MTDGPLLIALPSQPLQKPGTGAAPSDPTWDETSAWHCSVILQYSVFSDTGERGELTGLQESQRRGEDRGLRATRYPALIMKRENDSEEQGQKAEPKGVTDNEDQHLDNQLVCLSAAVKLLMTQNRAK